jgi:hypothetical protein
MINRAMMAPKMIRIHFQDAALDLGLMRLLVCAG